jgi:hypothetical protein
LVCLRRCVGAMIVGPVAAFAAGFVPAAGLMFARWAGLVVTSFLVRPAHDRLRDNQGSPSERRDRRALDS